jgi:hypothetical protein
MAILLQFRNQGLSNDMKSFAQNFVEIFIFILLDFQ